MFENILGEKSQWFWGMMQFFGLIISLAFIYRQLSLSRQGNMLQAISGVDQKWISAEFVALRLTVCERFSHNTLKINRSESELLGFFEDMGIYLKRGVFDDELIWDKYSYFIEHYWLMYEKHIKEFRALEGDDTWFEQFEYLFEAMCKYSKCRKEKIRYGSKTKESIDLFIKGEKQEVLPKENV